MPKVSREPVVRIDLDLEPNDYAPDFEDAETLAWVEREIERGSEWAWFTARVSANITGPNHFFQRYEGVAYLGGCSYEDRESFYHPQGYWPDLMDEAVDDLELELMRAEARGEIRDVASVQRALVRAHLKIDLYRKGYRQVRRAPDALLDALGTPCYREHPDKQACRVLLDALLDGGYLTEETERRNPFWTEL